MLSFAFFVYGASIGSFIQVIVERLHVAPIISSRSKCLTCGHRLAWTDLFPIISCLWLRGKCRYCKHRFGIGSLAVETFFGSIFALLYHTILSGHSIQESVIFFVYYTLLFVTLGVMALYDLKHHLIPGSYLLGFLGLTFLMFGVRVFQEHSVEMLLGPIFLALPFLVIWMISRGKWIGLGDVILFFGVGAFFGISQGSVVVLYSAWIGALYGVMLLLQKNGLRKTSIPFIPSIVLAFLLVLFTDIDFLSLAQILAAVY